MYDALDIKNIEGILPPPMQPQPTDPATENGNALKGMPVQAFQQQDHEAHVRAHIAFLSTPAGQANPQTFILLQMIVVDLLKYLTNTLLNKFREFKQNPN